MFPISNQLSHGSESPLASALLRIIGHVGHGGPAPHSFMPMAQGGFPPAAGGLVHGGPPLAAAPGAPPAVGPGPQLDQESGLAPPWPGAVVAVYDHGQPIYYGTPQWDSYRWQHGLMQHQPAAAQGVSPLLSAILGRFHPQPMLGGAALGHGPVL